MPFVSLSAIANSFESSVWDFNGLAIQWQFASFVSQGFKNSVLSHISDILCHFFERFSKYFSLFSLPKHFKESIDKSKGMKSKVQSVVSRLNKIRLYFYPKILFSKKCFIFQSNIWSKLYEEMILFWVMFLFGFCLISWLNQKNMFHNIRVETNLFVLRTNFMI